MGRFMKKYFITGGIRGSIPLGEVVCESLEEAMKNARLIAEERSVSFCHRCACKCQDPLIHTVVVCSEDLNEHEEFDLYDY